METHTNTSDVQGNKGRCPGTATLPKHGLQLKELLNRKEAASYLGVSAQTLAAWASNQRVEIPFVRLSRRVMYRLVDLQAFCASNLHAAGNKTEAQ